MEVGDCGSRVEGSGLSVEVGGFRVQGAGFRVQGGVWGSAFRVQGSGFRVQGQGHCLSAREEDVGRDGLAHIHPPYGHHMALDKVLL